MRRGCAGAFRRPFSSSTSGATASRMAAEEGRKVAWGGVVFFSAVSMTAAGLCAWQVQRYNWKKNLISTLETRVKEEPVSLGCTTLTDGHVDSETRAQFTGRRVELTGSFLHEHEMLLGPRAAQPGLARKAARGMASNPMGYYIITPFKINDSATVLVNRGWVPMAADAWSRPEGQVKLVGLVADLEKGNFFSPPQSESNLKQNTFFWLEEKLLAHRMQQLGSGTNVLLFDAVNEKANSEILGDDPLASDERKQRSALPLAKEIDLLSQMYVHPATHLAYVFTWGALSLAALGVAYLQYRGKQKNTLKRFKSVVEGATK